MKFLLFLFLFPLSLSAREIALSAENSWSDRAFRERFIQSYNARSEVEPAVNRAEQNLLQEVANQMAADDLPAAILQLDSALRTDSSAALYFVSGNLHFNRDDTARAETRYREALDRFPDFLRAHQNLALVLLTEGRYDQALDHLREVYRLGGREAQTYGMLAFTQLQRQRFASAENAYRMALLLEPDELSWSTGLVQSLLGQDRNQEAEGLIDELRKSQPLDRNLLALAANLRLRSEEPLAAAPLMEILRQLGEADTTLLLTLADFYTNAELTSRALPLYLEALEVDPAGATGSVLRAVRVMRQRGEESIAETLLGQIESPLAEASAANRLIYDQIRAEQARAAGDEDLAIRLYRRLAEAEPRSAEFLVPLAELYADQGNRSKADLLWEQATGDPTTRGRIRTFLSRARFLAAEGRFDEAVAQMDQALALESNPSWQRYRDGLVRLAGDS